MSNELKRQWSSDDTLYARVRNDSGQVWNTSGTPAFEAWDDANITDYDIAMTDKEGHFHIGTFPSAITAGWYWIQYCIQAGSTPAVTDETDGEPELFVWSGTTKTTLYQAEPGDYAVTLTIRDTDGSALSGVEVWLNTASDRSSAVAGVLTTGDTGVVTFNLDYVKYYIFCHKAGYTFVDADMTPASGSVTFTKDIGTASTTGGSNYSDSFLTRGIAATRQAVDEPAINAKYSDSDIITQMESAYAIILAEVNRNTTTPVVARTTVTVVSGTTSYVLPSVVGSVYAIYQLDSTSGVKVFYDSFGRFNPLGQSLWLEGNVLHLQAANYITAGTELTVEYVPSGTARLHNGVSSNINTDGDEVTLSATPNKGSLDTHDDAYNGCVLRILRATGSGATGDYLQERHISAYDHTTRVATLDVALSPIPVAGSGGYIIYEIAPTIHKGMDTVLALYAAYAILSIEGNRKRADSILSMYRNQMRNLRLNSYYSFLQTSTKMRADSYDNRRYRRIGRQ